MRELKLYLSTVLVLLLITVIFSRLGYLFMPALFGDGGPEQAGVWNAVVLCFLGFALAPILALMIYPVIGRWLKHQEKGSGQPRMGM